MRVQKMIAVLKLVEVERQYQNVKWGDNSHSNEEWAVISQEEAGEAARALLDIMYKPDLDTTRLQLVKELSQHAAVLVAWLEDFATSEEITKATDLRKLDRDKLATLHSNMGN